MTGADAGFLIVKGHHSSNAGVSGAGPQDFDQLTGGVVSAGGAVACEPSFDGGPLCRRGPRKVDIERVESTAPGFWSQTSSEAPTLIPDGPV